mmetsp:Transcript_10240/g.21601  ORF Transcript_10240/g.21601 Transcript_10240/m.21601 type:complete len:246 (+) Transcript_10240:948-1685(+)
MPCTSPHTAPHAVAAKSTILAVRRGAPLRVKLPLQIRQPVVSLIVRRRHVLHQIRSTGTETPPKAPRGRDHGAGNIGQLALGPLVLHHGRDRRSRGRKRSESVTQSRHDRRGNGTHVEISSSSVASMGIVIRIAAHASHPSRAASHATHSSGAGHATPSEFGGHAGLGLVAQSRLTCDVLFIRFARESFHPIGIFRSFWSGAAAACGVDASHVSHGGIFAHVGFFFWNFGWFGFSLRPSLQNMLI